MAKSRTRKPKQSYKPQGHPARAAVNDPLLAKVQRVMGMSVELVKELRDAGFEAESEVITHAMGSAVGWMTVSAMMEGVPTPYELQGWTRHTAGVRGRTWDPPSQSAVEPVVEPVSAVGLHSSILNSLAGAA